MARRSPEDFLAFQQAKRDQLAARQAKVAQRRGLPDAGAPLTAAQQRVKDALARQAAKFNKALDAQLDRFKRATGYGASDTPAATGTPATSSTPGSPFADAADDPVGASTPGWGGASGGGGGGGWAGDAPDVGAGGDGAGKSSGKLSVKHRWWIAGGVVVVGGWVAWRYVTAPYRSIYRSIGFGEKFLKSLGAK